MVFNKASFDKEIQRARIANNSIFGCWVDLEDSIYLKISPLESSVRIKIIETKNKAVMERISSFCHLKFPPRRIKWKGFDFITGLLKENEYYYNHGVAHIPNATRRNFADMTVLDNSKILLGFYFIDTGNKRGRGEYTGTLSLLKLN